MIISENKDKHEEDHPCNKTYIKLDKIGRGTYGTVYKVQDNLTKEIFAVKKVKFEDDSEGVPTAVLREVVILKKMDHQNIIKLKDIEYGMNKLFLHFEFLPYDLAKYMNEQFIEKGNNISVSQIKLIMFQILSGLSSLHSKKVIHRDIKPQNILIDDKCRVKIADFGFSRIYTISVRQYTEEVCKNLILNQLLYFIKHLNSF
jgi:serine/threonine protein kinase